MAFSFFADSSFLIKYAGADGAEERKKAETIYNILLQNKIIEGFQNFVISNLIVVEVFHKIQDKLDFRKAQKFYQEYLKKSQLIYVNEEIIEDAISMKLSPFCNRNTGKPSIGLVDGTNLVIMDNENISYIISFDTDFDNFPLYIKIKSENDVKNNFQMVSPKRKNMSR